VNRLAESGATASLGNRALEVAERIPQARDLGQIQALLHEATLALGAERSFFASVSGEGRDACYTFVLDCDPGWWHSYRSAWPVQANPWFVYAIRHSATVRATQLGVLEEAQVKAQARAQAQAQAQQRAVDIAATAGFASAVLIPVHAGRADHRVSLLCLGHSVAGHFEDVTFANLLVGARSIATELHEWWARHEQQQLAQRTQLTELEIGLLERHCAGLSSKQIAGELHVSRESINSRFQRITTKLGVRNRRAAARMAVECGLIVV
jgi:DNA-binding CsgD family transcriptional regulator